MDAKQEYLHHVILPYYQGFATKPFRLTVVDSLLRILFTTNLNAKLLGYSNVSEICGKFIDEAANLQPAYMELLRATTRRCQALARPVEHLAYWDSEFLFITYSPLYFPDQECLGVELYARNLNVSWYMDLYVLLRGLIGDVSQIESVDFSNYQLNEIQEQVLFLKIIGMSQYEIAAFLQRSRNTIKDIINSLYLKFKIHNHLGLETAAVKSGFHRRLPPSLLTNNAVLSHIYDDAIVNLARGLHG